MNKLQNIAVIFLLCIIAILLGLNLLKDNPATNAPTTMAPEIDPEKDPYMKNQVKNTIVKNSRQIQECYNKLLERKPEKFEGQVKVDWQVKSSGKVKSAEVVTSQLGDELFRKCLASEIMKFQFPEHNAAKPKYVVHKFFFKKSEEAK